MTTPTPEAIEAVAKVIYESNPIPAGFLGGSEEPVPWERLGKGWKVPHRLTATAALSDAAPLIAAQAKAEALREAADDLNPQLREYRLGAHEVLTQKITPHGGDDTRSLQLALVAAKQTQNWLRARASIIEAAE